HVPTRSLTRTVVYVRSPGAPRFAALIPDGDYGRRAADALSQSVGRAGGTLVATERYDRGNTSIVSAAERLKAKGGYDAVLIADSARLAAMAAGALKEGNAQVFILGTELWSGEANLTNSSAVRAAWFSAVSEQRFGRCVRRCEARVGAGPER